MQLTHEDLAKLKTKEVANAIRKLHAGKTLTAAERALLAGAADVQTPGLGGPAIGYVGTWDELAKALGVTRRAIQDWRNDPRHAPEIKKRAELLERADGRHCVAEWLRLMADLRLKRGTAAADVEIDPENAGDDEEQGIIKPPPVGGSQTQWNVAIAALEHRKRENAVRTQEGTLLEAADLEVPLGATFATIQAKLSQFPARVARYLVGLRESGEIEDKLRDEIDADLADLHIARYTADDAVAVAVASLPFDAESEKLFRLVTFDGQDRTTLLQLITAVATRALRDLGRRAISAAQREEPSSDSASIVSDARVQSPAPTESSPRTPAAPASKRRDGRAKPTPKKPTSKAKAKRHKKPRPKPAAPPAEVEALIVAPKKKRRR